MAISVFNSVCNLKDGNNDFARNILGTVLTAASIAAAAHNADAAWRIAQKEWNLAKKYWRIAENWLRYYHDAYAPVEDKEAREAFDLKVEEPEYEVARGRAKATAWANFRGLAHKAVSRTTKYCTGRRQNMLEELAAAQANALAMCDGLGYRNERAYIESRDEVRFLRQYGTVQRGRNMVANAPSYGRAAAGIYGELYKQAWEGLVGAGQTLGYVLNRANTEYPTHEFMQMQPLPSPYPQTAEEMLRQAIPYPHGG